MVTMARLNKEPKKLEDKLKDHDAQIDSVSETPLQISISLVVIVSR